MLIMVAVIAALVLLLFSLGDNKKPPTGLTFAAAPRSTREVAIDEDMALVSEAYRESELNRMRKEAIAKVASMVESNTKAK